MNAKIKIPTILIVFFLSCHIVNAQEIISNDTLIGEWTFYGPEKLTINDTITLSKELRNKNEYTIEWIFNSDNEFSIYTRYAYDKESDTQKAIGSKGDKWLYDNKLNILKIQKHNTEQHFMIILYQEQSIKLVMIK
jgi:hypothetical protein